MPTTVVWIEATSSKADGFAWLFKARSPACKPLRDALVRGGYQLIEHQTLDLLYFPSAVAVIVAGAFTDEQLINALRSARRSPVILLTEKGDASRKVLAELRGSDDIATLSGSPDVALWRIERVGSIGGRSVGAMNAFDRDELSGLLNRRAWFRLATERLNTTGSSAIGLILVDLDRFKTVNDRFGHQVGDEVIKHLALWLGATARPGDLVGRYGGEEFVLLIERDDRATVRREAGELVTGFYRMSRATSPLTQHQVGDAQTHELSISAGLAVLDDGDSIESITGRADMALYAAKEQGRNRMVASDDLSQAFGGDERKLRVQHFENVARVVTERVTNLITLMARRLIDEATQDATVDVLTGLRNRRYMEEHLGREFDAALRYGRPLSLIFLDIDHFHDINVEHGWQSGDAVLRAFGLCLDSSVRSVDWSVRYGGEEFLVVLPDTSIAQATEIAERIRANAESLQLMSLEGRPIPVTASLGVAQRTDEVTPQALIEAATLATRCAKASGRNRVVEAG